MCVYVWHRSRRQLFFHGEPVGLLLLISNGASKTLKSVVIKGLLLRPPAPPMRAVRQLVAMRAAAGGDTLRGKIDVATAELRCAGAWRAPLSPAVLGFQ